MLLPEPHAIWLVAFLLVVVTRSFTTPFVPLGGIMAMTWMTSSANQLTGADTFDFVVRQPHFVLYGAAAGYAIAAAVGSRVIIPVHSFAGKRAHLAGPLSLISVSCAAYALATATGLTKVHEPFGDWASNPVGEAVLFWVMFAVLVVIFVSILFTSWRGSSCPLSYRYRDGGVRSDAHPPSRFAAESVIALTLLIAPHFIWIYTTHPPVGWPQYTGGLIALGVEVVVWIAVWRLSQERYDMEMTYFGTDQSRMSWANFVAVVAGVHIGSMVAYIISASFLDTGLATEILIITTTLVTIAVAILAWLLLTPAFTERPLRKRSIFVPSSTSDGYPRAPISEVERQRRFQELL